MLFISIFFYDFSQKKEIFYAYIQLELFTTSILQLDKKNSILFVKKTIKKVFADFFFETSQILSWEIEKLNTQQKFSDWKSYIYIY